MEFGGDQVRLRRAVPTSNVKATDPPTTTKAGLIDAADNALNVFKNCKYPYTVCFVSNLICSNLFKPVYYFICSVLSVFW